jgi:hypothetical protein
VFDLLAQPDHLALSRVSRRLHRLVGSHLYSQFTWLPDNKKFSPIPLSRLNGRDVQVLSKTIRKRHHRLPHVSTPPTPYLLLRTILERPRLACHFKHVKLLALPPSWGTFWDPVTARELGFNKKQFEILELMIKESGRLSKSSPTGYNEHFSGEKINALHQGRLDIIVALLLSRMSSLATIDIRLRDSSTVGNPMFDFLGSISKRFGQTTSITVSIDPYEGDDFMKEYYWNEDAFCIDTHFAQLLQFDNLQELHVNHLMPDWTYKEPLPVAKRLKMLKLTYGCLDERELRYILQATPQLQQLDIHLCFGASTLIFLYCDKLSDALAEVKETLERLSVSLHVVNGEEAGWDAIGCLTSLIGFQKLKWLEFPLSVLLGNAEPNEMDLTKVLPQSLEWFMNTDHSPSTGEIADAHRKREAIRAMWDYPPARRARRNSRLR